MIGSLGADAASCEVPGHCIAQGSFGNTVNDKIIIMFCSTEAAVIALIFVLAESVLNWKHTWDDSVPEEAQRDPGIMTVTE